MSAASKRLLTLDRFGLPVLLVAASGRANDVRWNDADLPVVSIAAFKRIELIVSTVSIM